MSNRPTGRVDRALRGSVVPVVSGLTSVRPEIVMPAADSNQPPVIYVPEAALIPLGETTNLPILAGDPDSDQPVTLTGNPFAVQCVGGGVVSTQYSVAISTW